MGFIRLTTDWLKLNTSNHNDLFQSRVITVFHSVIFQNWLLYSVTRLGNLLDFGQVFKTFGNN